MYTNPYLVLNEKGRPRGCPFFCFFSFPDSPVSPPAYAKKRNSLLFTLFFNLYFDQYEVMPHSIILENSLYRTQSHAMLIYLIRPRASLSCRLERWPLGIYFTEVVAEFFGEAFDDFRVTGAKVVLFRRYRRRC